MSTVDPQKHVRRPPGATARRVAAAVAAATLAALLGGGGATADPAAAPRAAWATDAWVDAIAISGSTAYIGGDFTRVGPLDGFAPGHFVALDAASGRARGIVAPVSGAVFASAPDGSGGWYVGGDFRTVADVPRANLAHIRADGTLDPVWAPRADLTVTALAVSGSTVYAGGFFTTVDGSVLRNHFAAFDAATGAVTDWDPDAGGAVRALAVSGSTVFAGGDFTTVNGSTARNRLAAFDVVSGAATAFDPDVDAPVQTLAVSGSTVYAGGDFATVNGSTPRNRLAAFDAATGAATRFDAGLVRPGGGPWVTALAVSGSTVFVGGGFTGVNGSTPRNNLAAVDAATGTVEPFDPDLDWTARGSVHTLAVSGSTVYAGGGFTTVNGSVARGGLAAFDGTTGAVEEFVPTLNERGTGSVVRTLGVDGSTVYAGGDFGSAGGVARNHLAAIDLATGAATPFDPAVDYAVFSLALSGPTLYAGGLFRSVNGATARNHLAAFDTATGVATGFDPDVDDAVDALAVSGSTVYAGGNFTTANGTLVRDHLAAFDASSGAATGFDPDVDGRVLALAVSGPTLFAGGDFTTVNGSTDRGRLAAFDTATGSATAFDADVDATVRALAVSGSTVYAGGDFTTVNGSTPRNRLAAFDTATGAATGFDPDANGGVGALAVVGSTVYAGGDFTTVNGSTPRNRLAAFAETGAAGSWNPAPGSTVSAVAAGGGDVVVGGGFATLGGAPAPFGLAVFSGLPGAPTSVSATPGESSAAVTFAPPAQTGADVPTYTVTAAPGGATATGAASPITVSGLAPGTAYTFTVTASNALGTGPASAASAPVVPTTSAAPSPPPAGSGGGGSGGGGGGGGGGVNPNLVATIAADRSGSVQVGDSLTVSFSLAAKAGNGLSQRTHLIVDLPQEVTVLGLVPADRGSGCAGDRTLDCNLDFLDGGQSATVRVTVRVDGGTTLVFSSRAVQQQEDADPRDNGASLTLPVRSPAVVATATPAPRPAVKPVVRPLISKPTLSPARPVAGRWLTVSFRIRRSDTGRALTSGRMICAPSLNGRTIAHRESFRAGTARLAFLVPRSARGKQIKVKLTVRTGTRSATRSQAIRIR